MDKSRSNSKQKVETKQVDLDTGMPDLPKKELFAITFAFLGINMAFSLQSSQMSRICQTIGANPNNLGFFFIFPPLMGMIVQPIMGKMSDRTSFPERSEEHTSELQSRFESVCRL